MKTLIGIIAISLIISACNNDSKYPSYSKSSSGIYYKLEKIGENDQKPKAGDYITIDLVYKTIKDSIFFTGHRKLQLTRSEFEGSIDECFSMLNKGDKAEFIIHANDFFKRTLQSNLPSFLTESSDIKIEINVIDIQTMQDFENHKKAFVKWIEDFGDYEREILLQYIHQKKIAFEPTASGIYYMKTQKGNGRKVALGDTLEIEFEGRFLDGKFFDSTVKRKESFYFVYGTEWQLIKGLEEVVGMMEEGEKALAIMPSELAFGSNGSTTGIIPPFTSLIFEVEVKKIN